MNADNNQKIQLAIKASPDEIWEVLTDGEITPSYYMGFTADFNLEPGAGYAYTANGSEVITGEVLSVEQASSLKVTFNGKWDPEVAELPQSEVTFTIFEPFMPMPGVTFLSCVHEGLPATDIAKNLEMGWVSILSGLKTVLETGAPLVEPPS